MGCIREHPVHGQLDDPRSFVQVWMHSIHEVARVRETEPLEVPEGSRRHVPRGRAVADDRHAECLERLARQSEVVLLLFCGHPGRLAMPVTVRRELVAGLNDLPDAIGMVLRHLARHEEGRAQAVSFQHVEDGRHRDGRRVPSRRKPHRPPLVGRVVDHPDFFRVEVERERDGRALPLRPHRARPPLSGRRWPPTCRRGLAPTR